ncbi:MAG: hypothetical protein H7330_15115 [Hymenobacteraceae bacterium]|nr:hypothetical protein [Hymenobacteraceae bacterium]
MSNRILILLLARHCADGLPRGEFPGAGAEPRWPQAEYWRDGWAPAADWAVSLGIKFPEN